MDRTIALLAPLTAIVLLIGTGSPVHAQNTASLALQSGDVSNPRTSPEDVEAGEHVFQRSCAICHGGDGKGGEGPDLTRGRFRHGSSDLALFRNIRNGIRNTGMPGIYRPDADIWQVVSYVRSLSRGGGDAVLPGDPERGRQLYGSRGGCIDCHRIGGQGGRLGPELSDVGWKRAPANIRRSLLEPGAQIDDRYRTVEITTKSGELVTGILLNEDDYSIQLMDDLESLRSFDKRQLVKIDKPGTSLMPPMGGFFRGRDLEDLIAYLYSLREE